MGYLVLLDGKGERIFIHILLFLFISCAVSSASLKDKDYILVLNSYTEASPWSRNIITSIYDHLVNGSDEVAVYTEHLNMLSLDTENDLKAFKNELFKKYEQPPLAIVIMGNSAYAL